MGRGEGTHSLLYGRRKLAQVRARLAPAPVLADDASVKDLAQFWEEHLAAQPNALLAGLPYFGDDTSRFDLAELDVLLEGPVWRSARSGVRRQLVFGLVPRALLGEARVPAQIWWALVAKPEHSGACVECYGSEDELLGAQLQERILTGRWPLPLPNSEGWHTLEGEGISELGDLIAAANARAAELKQLERETPLA